MKLVFKLGAGALLLSALMACSGPESYRQASNSFDYLETSPLKPWQALPSHPVEKSSLYAIPERSYSGAVGPEVDIRPPLEVLTLVPNAFAQVQQDSLILWIEEQNQIDQLRESLNLMITQQQIPTRRADQNAVETDWVMLSPADQKEQIAARYLIMPVTQANRSGVQVKMLGLKINGIEQALDAAVYERYNTLMLNKLTSRYDQDLRVKAQIQAKELQDNISISTGYDRSGLTVLIARAPYEVFWEKVPAIFADMGFEITDKNRSQGRISMNYQAPKAAYWEKLGVAAPELKRKKYVLLLGDLGNRTSINITDNDGKPIDEAQLTRFEPVLKAVIAKLKNK